MSPEEYELIQDTPAGNNISSNADFLEWRVHKVHADGFTLGIYADKEGNFDESKNHWALIFQRDSNYIRLSMESRMNRRTGKHGVLVLHPLSYEGLSRSVVHRQTYSWKDPDITIKKVLEFTLTRGWHRYKMITTKDGGKKGCRYHLKTMLQGFQAAGWIGSKSDAGKRIDDFLPYVYTRDDDNFDKTYMSTKPIDVGHFCE
ncbi:hypothetical protein MHUMG1_10365 [Metarhizium humberi]|uniref:DUF7770 domain-containing protein n=1 Tax=Metarhizium humberi TaxID=2596975 RepID=A0A9P8M1L0_9HYPO|nr:hypothetical protein MHUMG1_10365 [Metarhizium humberi]